MRSKQRAVTYRCHAAWTGSRVAIKYVDRTRGGEVERVGAGQMGATESVKCLSDIMDVVTDAGEEKEGNAWCHIDKE